ncbi:MAG TPA: SprT family zinc-dependent metalloprotease [Sulfuriferula sp.]|nr:SprT family zinc-dependent metalloprotease [Sulfuriferula sp.]
MPELRRSSEIRSVSLNGERLGYTLKRSNARRTLALTINASGLSVNAPWRLPLTEVERFIAHKADWVRAKLDAVKSVPEPVIDWCDGMLLPYLGGRLQLRILPYAGMAWVTDQQLWLPVKTGTSVQGAVLAWYRRVALMHFQTRLQLFLPLLRCLPSGLLVSNARTRWGSCTRAGVVRLNWRLVQAPDSEIDYVLAHELAHLAHLDHSPAFWREVARLYPDFAAVRRGLHEHGQHYHRF